ncbi:MAG: hypothetical protein E7H07_06335 [Staphylococcus epidermidis]|nr:hypothetical protein [Staphylococcus epidermidis]
MKFREWTITINGKGPINVVANEDKVALKIDNETVQVKSLGYNEDVIINPNTKEITINVTNFLDDDE